MKRHQHPNRVRDVFRARHTGWRRCSAYEQVRAMLLTMSTTSRPPLRLISGVRDRHLVHLGATATNEELAQLISQLKHRATLRLVEGSQLEPSMAEIERCPGLGLPDESC
jgi:hypothetical protein